MIEYEWMFELLKWSIIFVLCALIASDLSNR